MVRSDFPTRPGIHERRVGEHAVMNPRDKLQGVGANSSGFGET